MKKGQKVFLVLSTVLTLLALLATVLSVTLLLEGMTKIEPTDKTASEQLGEGIGRAFDLVFAIIFAFIGAPLGIGGLLFAISPARSESRGGKICGRVLLIVSAVLVIVCATEILIMLLS